MEGYEPTPILAPWNGGSGFFPGDNKDGFAPISASDAPRFQTLRRTIDTASKVLADLHLSAKPDPETKPRLLQALRAEGSEKFLAWLDAAVVLSSGDPAYPPLLGTGGNDGRLDFTNNFLQRLAELFDVSTGAAIGLNPTWLEQALQGTPSPRLSQRAIGQFAPGQIGGANATSGFSTDSRINPWDFVLMLEGALLFVTATSRRLESNRQATLAYPFTVYASSGGSGGMAQPDAGSSRGEIWMPLWKSPVRHSELRVLLAEGRATLGRRPVRDGLDFARAVSRLGTDRGLSAFQRYGFMVRNGLAYLATPIARVESRRVPGADLINDLERGHFLDLLRRYARGKDTPASLRCMVGQLENALFALTRPGAGRASIQRPLILLGEVMQTLAVSGKGQEAVPTLPSLSAAWVLGADDDTPEFRLALALASMPRMAAHVVPVGWNPANRRLQWQPDSRSHVWGKGDLVRKLIRVVARRMTDAKGRDGHSEPFGGSASLGVRCRDLHVFLAEQTDDSQITGLLQGLIWAQAPEALTPSSPSAPSHAGDSPDALPVAFGILKPSFVDPTLLRFLERLPKESRWVTSRGGPAPSSRRPGSEGSGGCVAPSPNRWPGMAGGRLPTRGQPRRPASARSPLRSDPAGRSGPVVAAHEGPEAVRPTEPILGRRAFRIPQPPKPRDE